MSKRQQRGDRRGELWAPRALGEDISKLYESPIAVPPEVDEKIAEAADAYCEAARARRRIVRWGRVDRANERGRLLGRPCPRPDERSHEGPELPDEDRVRHAEERHGARESEDGHAPSTVRELGIVRIRLC